MPYCIYCGKQYKKADRFCMNCGKALPVSANPAIQPLQPPRSSKGSPEKIRAIIFSLTVLIIALAVYDIISNSNKEPVKKSSKYDEDRARDENKDLATADSAAIITPMQMDTLQPAYEGGVAPVEAVPDETITVVPDTVNLEMPPAYPTYINSDTRELQFFSPCYVIVTGFYKKHNMARDEARRLTSNGYSAAYLNISSFPVFKNQDYYATVLGPYKTSSECWRRLRSLQRTGPHWYGVKLTFDEHDRVELKP